MKEYLITLTFLLAVALFAVPATAAIVSDFTYTVDPSDPLTIHFTEKSTGGAGSWFWMFNDGGRWRPQPSAIPHIPSAERGHIWFPV